MKQCNGISLPSPLWVEIRRHVRLLNEGEPYHTDLPRQRGRLVSYLSMNQWIEDALRERLAREHAHMTPQEDAE